MLKLQLFNTLTRQKELFTPLTEGRVRMYSCGPTVYGEPHIGNLRAFIFADVLRRTLEMAGYAVTAVMNITDVGHLVSDENAGEDKLEKGARASGQTVWEVAAGYTTKFFDAVRALNLKSAEKIGTPEEAQFFPRATGHIGEQLALIRRLTAAGLTYEISDGIYFDTAKFANYGALSGQKLNEKVAGARVEINAEKHSPADFALWKFCVGENATHTMRWDFASGADFSGTPERGDAHTGFPGWHIECSAMSLKYLAEPAVAAQIFGGDPAADIANGPAFFDIHTGGVDHIPVHHENEIAQTEGACDHRFANFWLHNEFLTVDGGKMSKSLGNVWTVGDLAARGFDPLAFRLLALGTHYRQKLNFTWEAVAAADATLQKLRREMAAWPIEINAVPDATLLAKFAAALADDLNTAAALAVLFETLKANIPAATKRATVWQMDAVLGLRLDLPPTDAPVAPTAEQAALLAERAEARKNKDFARSDALRDQFLAAGFVIEDAAHGQILRRK